MIVRLKKRKSIPKNWIDKKGRKNAPKLKIKVKPDVEPEQVEPNKD